MRGGTLFFRTEKDKITLAVVLIICICAVLGVTAQAKAPQECFIPAEYQQYCEEIGAQYGICPELLEAIIESESSGNAKAVNGRCLGLMQINEPFHRKRMAKLGVSSLYDPYGNILVATDYLTELAGQYKDLPMVLMTYNGSRDAKWRNENADYTQYASKIMNRAQELERLHEKTAE